MPMRERKTWLQVLEHLELAQRAIGLAGQRRQGEWPAANRGGDSGFGERFQRLEAQRPEHVVDLRGVRADVPAGEGIGRGQRRGPGVGGRL